MTKYSCLMMTPERVDHEFMINKVQNLTIFNYHQKIDILVIINQSKTNSI